MARLELSLILRRKVVIIELMISPNEWSASLNCQKHRRAASACGMPWRSLRLAFACRSLTSSYRHTFSLDISPPVCILSKRWISNSPAAVNNNNEEQAPQATELNPVSFEEATKIYQPFTQKKLLSLKGEPPALVKLSGLVQSVRKQKSFAFAHISDGSVTKPFQAVLSPKQAEDITNGCYLEVQGRWEKSLGKGQSHELQVDNVTFLGESDPNVSPIQKQATSVDFLRSIPHLRFRKSFYSLINQTRSRVIQRVHSFYAGYYAAAKGLDEATYVQPPLITSSDCEGAGEVFTISPKSSQSFKPKLDAANASLESRKENEYFKEAKYLTVSSQLHLEAYSAAFGDVWTLSPTFRAEESDTPRHLSEFYMLESEFRGITRLSEVTNRVQRLIKCIANGFRDGYIVADELLAYHKDPKFASESSDVDLKSRWMEMTDLNRWQTVTYTDAINQLRAAFARDDSIFENEPRWDEGLSLEHERWITKHLSYDMPIFVTHYPRKIKPFYMLPSSQDEDVRDAKREAGIDPDETDENPESDTVACFDLLFPHGTCEIVGGSLREHRLENLIAAMREKGLLQRKDGGNGTPITSNPSNIDPQSDHEDSSTSSSASSPYPFLRPNESLGTMKWYADLRRYGSSPHGGFGMGFDRLLMHITGATNVREVVAFPRTWGRADC